MTVYTWQFQLSIGNILAIWHTAGYDVSMETFGERMRRLRYAKGHTKANEFAKLIGRDPSFVSRIERGSRRAGELPDYKDLVRIADAFEMSVAELTAGLGNGDQPPQTENDRLRSLLLRIGAWLVVDTVIPLDQDVSAARGKDSKGGHIPQGLEGVEALPLVKGRQLYALRVTGDCMGDEVKPGEVVHFDPARPAEDGDMVVAAKDGEKALVKWLDQRGTIQYLLPVHGDPIPIDDSIEVIGVVEDIVRKARRRRGMPRPRLVSPLQQPLIDND
jgi:transcriptional regulator with XRE-family HTH domain